MWKFLSKKIFFYLLDSRILNIPNKMRFVKVYLETVDNWVTIFSLGTGYYKNNLFIFFKKTITISIKFLLQIKKSDIKTLRFCNSTIIFTLIFNMKYTKKKFLIYFKKKIFPFFVNKLTLDRKEVVNLYQNNQRTLGLCFAKNFQFVKIL